jgi:hypothetical protein
MPLQLLKNKAREGSGHGDYCDPCQMLGFISGRVTVTLTGNSDSWDVPQENKAAIFENLFNTQTKGFFRLSALGHCVQQAGSPHLTSACSRLLFSVTYTLTMVGNCVAFSDCAVGARTQFVAAQIRRNHYGY